MWDNKILKIHQSIASHYGGHKSGLKHLLLKQRKENPMKFMYLAIFAVLPFMFNFYFYCFNEVIFFPSCRYERCLRSTKRLKHAIIYDQISTREMNTF